MMVVDTTTLWIVLFARCLHSGHQWGESLFAENAKRIFPKAGIREVHLVYEKSQVQLCHTCYFLEDGKGDGFWFWQFLTCFWFEPARHASKLRRVQESICEVKFSTSSAAEAQYKKEFWSFFSINMYQLFCVFKKDKVPWKLWTLVHHGTWYHQEFQVPKMEGFLNLKAILGMGIPLHKPSIRESFPIRFGSCGIAPKSWAHADHNLRPWLHWAPTPQTLLGVDGVRQWRQKKH